jgi:hypothetical protein
MTPEKKPNLQPSCSTYPAAVSVFVFAPSILPTVLLEVLRTSSGFHDIRSEHINTEPHKTPKR